jgi:uncharacterized protein with NAD-binding domain and iron-sulfur cluster
MAGSVAVFGAGTAGPSAAHELSRLGHAVAVYESTDRAGGFFRSDRRPGDGGHAVGVLLARPRAVIP